MILTGRKRSTWRKTCPIASLHTINPKRTCLGSNPGLDDASPVTIRPSHATVPDDSPSSTTSRIKLKTEAEISSKFS